ncbi:MAG: polysaccharide deacetylase family protein [Flavisolibacter sp.]|nr:polysaccharide deacetylase family protein [Flavisolibacter sp.]
MAYGAIIRGDTTKKQIALVFTGDEFAEGGDIILKTLQQQKIKASFFFTGRFYRNSAFTQLIQQLRKEGHYLGAHSDQHLLYCDWTKRDSLLVNKEQFLTDLHNNYAIMQQLGIRKRQAPYFLPPYEWYNDSIAAWTKEAGLQLINYTPGTLSHTDYTTPDAKNYRDTKTIYQSIIDYENRSASGLNGFMLLLHIGTDAKRTDKFYYRLDELIRYLKNKNYKLVTVSQLLKTE